MFRYRSLKDLKEYLLFLSKHNFMLNYEIEKIRQYERLSEAEHTRMKTEKAIEIAQFAGRHSSFYRNLYKDINLKEQSKDLYNELPVVFKRDVLANRDAMCTTLPIFLKQGLTSGTSGTPLSVYRSPGSIIRENAYVWYFRSSHGLNVGDPIVSMRGKLDGSTLSYYNKAENTLYLSIYLLSPSNIRKYAQLIKEFQPKAICALPSTMFTFVNLLNQEEVDLHVPMVFTASSTLYPFQRDKIETTLSTKLIDWYGNAERTITLGQCPHGNYHEFPMYSLNEFRNNGVVTTSLTNRAFPLIRYFVDDKFTLLDGPCPCGREKAIRSVEGRFEDAVILADGRMVNGLGIAFQGIHNLRYAQIIQERINHLKINLVAGPAFSKHDEEAILKKLHQRMNEEVEIEFHRVQESDIIRTPAGKFTLVISRLDIGRLADSLRSFDSAAIAS
jgi:phenylacetate-CoA ligase